MLMKQNQRIIDKIQKATQTFDPIKNLYKDICAQDILCLCDYIHKLQQDNQANIYSASNILREESRREKHKIIDDAHILDLTQRLQKAELEFENLKNMIKGYNL